jgi:hypothetical protein
MQIDLTEQHRKHASSIRINRESAANDIDPIGARAKQDFSMTSTEFGMQIDGNGNC